MYVLKKLECGVGFRVEISGQGGAVPNSNYETTVWCGRHRIVYKINFRLFINEM